MYLFRNLFWTVVSLSITLFIVATAAILYLEVHLPSVETLNNVKMQIPLRVYTQDGELIGVFGEKRRIPVTLDQIPVKLVAAVLATEDQRFFEHAGVDVLGLFRAALELVRTGSKSQGGSTITMQVARNFFLSPKKTYVRKLNEILLAIKIDQTLSKDKILELYLNYIYFGNRAYGVAAAAEAYFGKTLQQLTLPEIALIAGLPKAPSSLNPLANSHAAKERRNHVLERMYKQNYIDKQTYQIAVNAPLPVSYHQPRTNIKAFHVAEMVRQIMFDRFGEDAYTEGFQVYTTIDSKLQTAADNAVKNAVINYDQRHGFRAPKINLKQLLKTEDTTAWIHYLRTIPVISSLRPMVVTVSDGKSIKGILANGESISVNKVTRRLKKGDVIYAMLKSDGSWNIVQLPEIEAALVALSTQDGAVKALVGGFDFYKSSFNRVTQAQRQAGSSFKPFIYSAALEKGFTLASIINDAPIEIEDPSLPEGVWRPQNDDHRFRGPIRLRSALAHSINLVTIRLLQSIGLSYSIDYLKHFGFAENKMPKGLSLALGTASVTPLELASAYSIFANGGYRISPYLIEHVVDLKGKTILTANPKVVCDAECPNGAPQVITAQNAFLVDSALREVINSGTGHAAKVIGRNDLAGKTGTSDDFKDTWFIGFNGDLVVGTWLGYDQPKPTYEHGAQAALPMWIEFMQIALKNQPEHFFKKPDGIVEAEIDPQTGLLSNESGVKEFFKEEDLANLSSPQSTEDEELLNEKENNEDEEGHLF